jgi:signal transduction histidine kinase
MASRSGATRLPPPVPTLLKIRLFVLATVLLVTAFLVALQFVSYTGAARLASANDRIALSQSRQTQLAMFLKLVIDVETAQRGFLLTGDARYLSPYRDALPRLEPLLDALSDAYIREDSDEPVLLLRELRVTLGRKLGEIEGGMRLLAEQGPRSAQELVATDLGRETMDEIRVRIERLQELERLSFETATASWQRDLRTQRVLMTSAIAMSILLVLLAAALVQRDLRRREGEAAALVAQNERLEREVATRTAELSELSTHLQRVSEIEKATLARDLHDELGGVLVAARMDAAWLRRRTASEDADMPARWDRLMHALDVGVDFKRRVIEALRPTLLDNLGLVPALRWVLRETCGRAGLRCTESYPATELQLSDEANITVFRLVQEALVNVIKHAAASSVHVAMAIDGDRLEISVRDDGRGGDGADAPRGHGLLGMRHRVRSLGGTLRVGPHPDGGMLVTVRLPLSRVLADSQAGVQA